MTLRNAAAEKLFSLAILGPTASGKSQIALELAKRLHAEIISCDSMQIYRDMDIGTAKTFRDWLDRYIKEFEKLSEMKK